MVAGPYWCWLCQHPREMCGGTDGSCPRVEAEAAQYRAALAAGEYKTLFRTRRLASEREAGLTQREIARSTVEAAKRDGREIESVSAYGDVKGPSRKTPKGL